MHFTQELVHRIFAGAGQPLGQCDDLIDEDRAIFGRLGNLACLDDRRFRVLLEPGDKAATLGVERGPPAEVIVAEIEDVEPALPRRATNGATLSVVLASTGNPTRGAS